MSDISRLLDEILNPADEYTPVPFWFFNDKPDEERLKQQLRDYVEKGVTAIVLHPRIGIPESIDYLSEEYFRWIRFITAEASALGMKIVLYDEGMYPSGSAHGMVAAENPQYASKGIRLADAKELAGLFGEQPSENARSSDGRWTLIRLLPDHRGIIYGFTGGTIRGIHFGEDDMEEGAPLSADILNPDAADCFIRLTHDRYYEELKEYFSDTIIGFFTDEPHAPGRNAEEYREWVPGLEVQICELGGKMDELEALFIPGQSNRTTAIYHRLIKEKLRDVYYVRLSEWCSSHGIALMGHPAESDDIAEEMYFHVPGQDLIMRRVAPETGGLTEPDSVQAKLTADLARELGCRRNMNECFGVCCRPEPCGEDKRPLPWYFTGQDMIWYINWLCFRGVNLLVPHAFYYSVEGARKEERPPDVGPNNIWWKHYRSIADYIKRLCCIMTDSVNDTGLAVLCDNNSVPAGQIAALYESCTDFRYLPVEFLRNKKAAAADGRIKIGEDCFDRVLNVGDREWDRYAEGAGVRLFHDVSEAVQPVLRVNSAAKGLRITSLRKNNVRMYLLCNEGDAEISTSVSGIGVGTAVKVDIWRGSYCCERLSSEGTLDVKLACCETMLIINDENSSIPYRAEEKSLQLGDVTDRLVLRKKEGNTAEYSMSLTAEEDGQAMSFSLRADDMAECFCGGEYTDFSLVSPHRFRVAGQVRKGVNEITIRVTGNAANIYERAEIPFGIKSS